MSAEEAARDRANASSIPQTNLAARLLPVYCVCGLVRDELKPPPGHIAWVTLRSDRNVHNTQSGNLLFTHTYCPKCLRQVRTGMQHFFRAQQERGHDPEIHPNKFRRVSRAKETVQ